MVFWTLQLYQFFSSVMNSMFSFCDICFIIQSKCQLSSILVTFYIKAWLLKKSNLDEGGFFVPWITYEAFQSWLKNVYLRSQVKILCTILINNFNFWWIKVISYLLFGILWITSSIRCVLNFIVSSSFSNHKVL